MAQADPATAQAGSVSWLSDSAAVNWRSSWSRRRDRHRTWRQHCSAINGAMRVPSPLWAHRTSAPVPSCARDRYANARRPVWGRTSVTSELRLRRAASNGALVRPRRQRGRTRARSAGRAQMRFVFLVLWRCYWPPTGPDHGCGYSACFAPGLANLTQSSIWPVRASN